MNHPLFYTGFFKFLIVWILLGQTACTNISNISSGDLSSSSIIACPGDGGLIPTPLVPQGLQHYSKFNVSESVLNRNKGVAILSKDQELSVIVNEQCLLRQSEKKSKLSALLYPKVIAQKFPIPERAYSLKLPFDISADHLRTMVEMNPCILSLNEEVFFYPVATTVNDPMFANQQHLTAIRAPEAWDIFYTNLTADVTVAIIDDGVDLTHPELSSLKWVNSGETAGNGVDDDGNGYIDDVNGYNFASNIGSPAQQSGSTHGTHVAGLVAAKDNNSVGITGVMGRNVKIMGLNTAGTQSGSSITNIINAINYARTMGAKVINISLGAQTSAIDSLRVALANAVAGGVFIAIAAGNDDEEITSSNFWLPVGYAKDIQGVMGVGALYADSLTKTSYSNYSSSYVEIGAPGSNTSSQGLLSTIPGSAYDYYDGTSMASPVVAGAAALLIGWASANGTTLTPAQVEEAILYSADSKASLTSYIQNGGSLNLKNLADSAGCL